MSKKCFSLPKYIDMDIRPEDIIKVDYTGAAQLLKPVVYKDGDSFCCLMGPLIMIVIKNKYG